MTLDCTAVVHAGEVLLPSLPCHAVDDIVGVEPRELPDGVLAIPERPPGLDDMAGAALVGKTLMEHAVPQALTAADAAIALARNALNRPRRL